MTFSEMIKKLYFYVTDDIILIKSILFNYVACTEIVLEKRTCDINNFVVKFL